MRTSISLILCLLSLSTFANYDAFKQRFEFVKKDGELIAVRDKSLTKKFSVKKYMNYIKNEILTEQSMMQAKGLTSYESELRDVLYTEAEAFDRRQRKNKNKERVVVSMRELGNIDFREVFKNPKFLEVMEKFEDKLKEAFFYIDPQLVAKPNNSSFFYKRALTHKAVSWALDLARKQLSTVPLLNTAAYVIKEVEILITKRRMYHQNLLLHYLEHASEDELGLTKKEADSIFSSIYESRIAWYAFWESSRAKLNWNRYGSALFYQGFRMATSKLRSNRRIYTSVDERLNYAFQEVSIDGERAIVNLVDTENMLKSTPAVAFYFDRPQKVRRLRGILTLSKLGLSFVPLPAFIKDIANDYMKSYYEKQQITEGALFAHFEMTGELDVLEKIKRQYINPFDLL